MSVRRALQATSPSAHRIVCAVTVAALHAGAMMQLGAAILAPAQAIAEQPLPKHRALLVTAFVYEEQARNTPRFATLTAADLLQATAIVLPLPQLPSIRPVATDSLERSREIADSEDLTKAERLQGRYIGQIKARLLRLLESRGSVPPDTEASCVMYVVQNERGQVLDVLSDECAADTQWQRDVETAIHRASPLPLPPEGLAMGSYLTLDLSSLR
jgi:TonB C terminal